jgi:hypothetical protein
MHIGVPATPLWTPANLGATVLAWLQGDLISGSDNDQLATWEDSTANNNDISQTTEANKPNLRTAYLDGKNVVEFNGANAEHLISAGNFLSGVTAASIFFVVERADDPAGSTGTTGLYNAGSDGAANHYPYINGIVYDGWGTTARKDTGNPTLSLATWRILNMHSASNDWKMFIDAVEHFPTGTNTVGFAAAFTLGTYGIGTGFHYTGHVAEVIITDTVLSQSNRENVEGYLAWKWGLEATNLPVGHPYESAPP